MLELSLLLIDIVDSLVGLFNVSLLLVQTGQLCSLVFFELGGALFSLREVFLQFGEHLGCGTGAELEFDQLAVALLDLLDVFLVSNLHLMEVDKLKVITHLLLLLNLSLGLEDGNFQSHIFLSELFNLGLFL